MDKARPALVFSVDNDPYFAQGSLNDPAILIQPTLPTTPFEFPFDSHHDTALPLLADEFDRPRIPSEGVQRVVGLPRVVSLHDSTGPYARVNRLACSATTHDATSHPSMMDSGANICVTGILGLLVDVSSIPPLPITIATKTDHISVNDCCTKRGYLPLMLTDRSVYYQLWYYCANASEIIISPDAILQSSDILAHWYQEGHHDGSSGTIRFTSNSGLYLISLTLDKRDGLYYCPTNVFTVAPDPVYPALHSIHRVVASSPPDIPSELRGRRFAPTSRSKLAESETWMLRLGSPGEDQLDLQPGNVTGVPPGFQYHPFRFINWKEEARIQKQAAQRSSERTTESQRRFYIDYGFMSASSSNYSRPDKTKDRVVLSYDGFLLYLLIVDKATRYIWFFLTKMKEPPTNLLDAFFTRFRHKLGGSVRTDQSGELAHSSALGDLLLRKHRYVLEPTGSDSPPQNGAVEIYNGKLAVRTCSLLYISGLPAKYWSSALLHSVYLHNRLVHTTTKITPFEAYYGLRPDLSHLMVFGSRVCVKISGIHCGKLDCPDFKGIFLGYTATDQNIVYLDLDTGVVKRSHHAQFDKAWYLQQT
jgi:hypothetical protein